MIRIRRAKLPGDPAEAFILDTLRRSYIECARGGRDELPARELVQAAIRRVLNGDEGSQPSAAASAITAALHDVTLRAPGCRVYVAEPATEAESHEAPLFLGWLCASRGVLRYVYVKRNLRKQGVAAHLIAHAAADLQAPMRVAPVMTWPWVETWLERNGVAYAPTRAHEQEEESANR